MGQTCCSGRKKKLTDGHSARRSLLRHAATQPLSQLSISRSESPPRSRRFTVRLKTKHRSGLQSLGDTPSPKFGLDRPQSPHYRSPSMLLSALKPRNSGTSQSSSSSETALWTTSSRPLLYPQQRTRLLLTSLSVYHLSTTPQQPPLHTLPISRLVSISCTANRQCFVLHSEEAYGHTQDLAVIVTSGELFLRKMMEITIARNGVCTPFQTIASEYVLERLINALPRKRVLELYDEDRLKAATSLFAQRALVADVITAVRCEKVAQSRKDHCLFVLTPDVIYTLKLNDGTVAGEVAVNMIRRIVVALEERVVGVESQSHFEFWTVPETTAEEVGKIVLKNSGQKIKIERVRSLGQFARKSHSLG